MAHVEFHTAVRPRLFISPPAPNLNTHTYKERDVEAIFTYKKIETLRISNETNKLNSPHNCGFIVLFCGWRATCAPLPAVPGERWGQECTQGQRSQRHAHMHCWNTGNRCRGGIAVLSLVL